VKADKPTDARWDLGWRFVTIALALGIALVATACSSGGSKGRKTTTTTGVALPQWAGYRQACASEGDACSVPPASFSGSLPGKLIRPLHFPPATGKPCPATPGRFVTTPDFASWTLGSGRVQVVVNNQGDLRHGKVNLAPGPAGWDNLKTHFFGVAEYRGPFLVRAKRIDRSGPIRIGATPRQAAPLVVPPGPTPNGTDGRREIPYFTFVKAPGCYGWQIDGQGFSEVIVAQLLPPLHS